MRPSHVAEDFRKLTLHPIMISVNLLMKTNRKLSVSHHSSLSRVLSRGMSSGFISSARLRMTNVSTKGIGRENFFIEYAFALIIGSNRMLKHFDRRQIGPMIRVIRLEINTSRD